MYQKADPASIKKIRRKCATVAPISPLRPPGEPSPTRQRGKNPKKYGANAPQLHPISYLSRTNPGKTKKYGANAPQLHAIRCSIDFCVMLCNEQAKKQKNTAQTRHSCTISFRGKPTRQSPAVGIARSILLYSCIQQNQPVPFV